ncbi:MAG: peptide ABC transporter substrate-binding protein [Candidatus Rokubacteria bacterium]|nr:peptide ABC transporter substrate-binding protein [Candidatus Rokubacteria bacterium]MBI3827147.1 peptide ABC transporter substrate-binding protein [Candidatus Rokubacteria bacterium]
MDEHRIRELLDDVKAGRLSRRSFIRGMVSLGLTAPLASQMLASAGVAQAQTKAAFNPTKRGGGGHLRTLWWQSPTLLNPHFAVGTKDQDASRVFYEPLAAFDPDGNLVPVLAAEAPSVQAGTVSKDGRSVTWRLKKNVAWHDGKPFTADDVLFNYEYIMDPATAAYNIGSYQEIEKIDKVDSHTVKLTFKRPMPFWADPFCGARGMILPKHVFAAYKGDKSREAPNNTKPVGTGPFKIVEFKPGDMVRAEINTSYHTANRPFFDTMEIKGGGDAISAARAVMQTAEYDFAWNMQVEDEILKRLETGGKGHAEITPTGYIEHIQCNQTDPWKEVDGERSSLKTKHPFLIDPAVRQALGLLVDRASVQEQIYGRTGIATANFLNAPSRFVSKNMKWELNVDKANQILEAAGWKKGPDGIRAKDGVKLKLVYATSVNAPRQKTQQIVKQAAAKAGIEMELKSVLANVFFASDPANPDTYTHFYTDLQMYTTTMTSPDPGFFMNQFTAKEAASKDNKWQGRNITRWQNADYDKLHQAAETELDPVKRAAMFVKMNDTVVSHGIVIPIVIRPAVAAISNKLKGVEQSGWDSNFWRLSHWYREA